MAKPRWPIDFWRHSSIALPRSNQPSGICGCLGRSSGITLLHTLQRASPLSKLCGRAPPSVIWYLMGKPRWILWPLYSLTVMRLFANSNSIWIELSKLRNMQMLIVVMLLLLLEIGCMWSFAHISNNPGCAGSTPSCPQVILVPSKWFTVWGQLLINFSFQIPLISIWFFMSPSTKVLCKVGLLWLLCLLGWLLMNLLPLAQKLYLLLV